MMQQLKTFAGKCKTETVQKKLAIWFEKEQMFGHNRRSNRP